MPGLALIPNETYNDEASEDSLKLWLPSDLSTREQDSLCLLNIPTLEFHFHYAQADNSLAELCHLHQLV